MLFRSEYKDTVFKYGKVGFKEESPEKVYLQFAFDVISSPFKKLEKKEEFKNYLGDLLTIIITKQFETEDKYYDENGTIDTKESDL